MIDFSGANTTGRLSDGAHAHQGHELVIDTR